MIPKEYQGKNVENSIRSLWRNHGYYSSNELRMDHRGKQIFREFVKIHGVNMPNLGQDYFKKLSEEIKRRWEGHPDNKPKIVPVIPKRTIFHKNAKDKCSYCPRRIYRGNYEKNGNTCMYCNSKFSHTCKRQFVKGHYGTGYASFLKRWKAKRVEVPASVIKARLHAEIAERKRNNMPIDLTNDLDLD